MCASLFFYAYNWIFLLLLYTEKYIFPAQKNLFPVEPHQLEFQVDG